MSTNFKELVIACDPETVFECLSSDYDDDRIRAYAEVIDKLLDLEPIKSEYIICLQEVESEDEFYTEVFGVKNSCDLKWSLSMMKWSEWLGMKIHETSQAIYTKDQIICHCLWEMTFYGFDEKTIEDTKNDILRDDEDFNIEGYEE